MRVRPHSKIVKFNMGDVSTSFPATFDLLSKADIQIRHNALESARLACNRYLEKILGKKGFYFEIRVFPHHILRENPLASGAGADRMSTGMKMSFGKPIGVAVQVRIGQPIFTVSVPKEKLTIARDALKRASKKLPCTCMVVQRMVEAVKKSPIKEPVKEAPAAEEKTVEEKSEPAVPEDMMEEAKEAPASEADAEKLPETEVAVDVAKEAENIHAEEPKSSE